MLLVASGNMLAAMNIFISYGTWLAREYRLGAVELGTVASFWAWPTWAAAC